MAHWLKIAALTPSAIPQELLLTLLTKPEVERKDSPIWRRYEPPDISKEDKRAAPRPQSLGTLSRVPGQRIAVLFLNEDDKPGHLCPKLFHQV